MIIQQLSIFLENRSGRLTELTETLAAENVNLSAMSVADTAEYGIVRAVVSDPEKARKVLKEKGFGVSLTDVLCLSTPNTPGSLARALRILSDAEVSVEYLYAFSMGEKSLVVIRTDDILKGIRVFEEHEMELMKASELYKI
ncbi:MAG: acetolactate synthase [Fibrobacter sp.]|nr:acetolactate synthase [Fibrobacter sp.]